MLKFKETKVTFSEVPDEVTLCINLTNCPFRCKGCHSPHLQEDIGVPLYGKVLISLMKKNAGITCVCFMGGDADPEYVKNMALVAKSYNPAIRTAWYSGNDAFLEDHCGAFDYIKTGKYIEKYGPLDKETTNQRMYKRICTDKRENLYEWKDITEKFWNKKL